MDIAAVRNRVAKVQESVRTAVVGRDAVVEQLTVGLLADGHILIEDLPGVGKTLLAKSFAQALGLSFARVQFTADLLPHDITGVEVFDPNRRSFEFRPGPLFTNLLLADEINRAPPKVQSALLEAMQEFQVTSERETHPLPRPFLVLATQNPIELEGTYPLPEAQVDRFLLQVAVGYPTRPEEEEILRRRRARKQDATTVPRVLQDGEFLAMQKAVEEVTVDSAVDGYIVQLVQTTRGDPRAEVGASPRGSLALTKSARARAVVQGRDFITPDDVKEFALPALAHRVIIKPEPWIRGVRGSDVVSTAVERTPVPKIP